MKSLLSVSCAVLASLCLVGAATAQKLSSSDADFLKKAAEGGQAEIAASKLAESKSSSAEVKAFASQMVADHTKSGEELKQLAAAKGVTLPVEPSKAQAKKLKDLESASGAAFDKRYAENFGVEAHQDMLKLVKSGTKAKDADVKGFAEKTLPTVEHHLDMGKKLKSAAGKTTTSAVDSKKP